MRATSLIAAGTVVSVVGSHGPAGAAGFAIREQSGSFQGLSFAGVAAGGADISTMYFNPATLALHEGFAAHASLSYVLPTAEFQLDEATDGAGVPTGGGSGGDIAADALVPAAYVMGSRGDLRFGLGLTAPFGLTTDQPDDWAGRYFATESELTTININPAVAYRLTDGISIGAGFVAQYADATLANAVDLRAVAAPPGAAPGAADGIAEVEGDDWDFGFTLGALIEPIEGTRLGVGYRSRINHSLTGDFELTFDGAVQRRAGGRAALSTPDVASLGVRQRLSDEFDLLGTVEWTNWSSFDTLKVTFDDGSEPSTTSENWSDSWFFALGVEWRPLDGLTLQAGAAYDQSPIDDSLRTPRIPGNDRTWLSLGGAWAPTGWLRVGAAYSRIFVEDGDIDLSDGQSLSGGQGTLKGRYENGINIVTLSGTLRF